MHPPLTHYRWLHSGGLDEHRLAFYTLAMRLSLVAGPLRLLDGDFPDREAMRGIAEYNLQQTLALLPADNRRAPRFDHPVPRQALIDKADVTFWGLCPRCRPEAG